MNQFCQPTHLASLVPVYTLSTYAAYLPTPEDSPEFWVTGVSLHHVWGQLLVTQRRICRFPFTLLTHPTDRSGVGPKPNHVK